jgi:hypothetical protein
MSAPSWLILLYTLPASRAATRLSLWRQLKRLGAVALKTSAYILPQSSEHEESYLWLAQQIRQDGGEATLLRSAEVDTLSPDEFIDLFQTARTAEYAEILSAAAALKPAGRRKSSAVAAETASEMERLRRRFQTIRKIDFFDCPAARKVEEALESPSPPEHTKKKSAPIKRADYQKRRWQTRPHPELDRVASAWLIRNFIDSKATFVFSADRGAFGDAVTFDMVDADFGHEGDDCTFETLLRRFSIKESVLAEIGEVVHAADIEDGKYARTEGAGLLAVLRGWAKAGVPDPEILRRGFELLDGLRRSLTAR